jgi:hypothetical protein
MKHHLKRIIKDSYHRYQAELLAARASGVERKFAVDYRSFKHTHTQAERPGSGFAFVKS